MENLEAAQTLQHAERLQGQARRAGAWYSAYLTVFAVASVIFAALFGFLGNRVGAFVATPLWLVFIAVLTAWSQRKKTALAGMGRIQGFVIGTWALLWGVTVIVGSFYFQQRPAWWVGGGLAMAVPCVVGAVLTRRRTSL